MFLQGVWIFRWRYGFSAEFAVFVQQQKNFHSWSNVRWIWKYFSDYGIQDEKKYWNWGSDFEILIRKFEDEGSHAYGSQV